jgi:hypothetical protein
VVLVLAAVLAVGAWPAPAGRSGAVRSDAPASGTLPSGAGGLPREDARCARRAGPPGRELRFDNYPANTTIPGRPVAWANDIGQTAWRRWIAKRDRVTGNFTGTTDQIFRWAGCKWGIEVDLIRAAAVQESDWHQRTRGDFARGRHHSWGIMQVRHDQADGTPDFGGHPATAAHTALNVDFYAAFIRSCLDGDYHDGGPWLYGGRTIEQVIAAEGQDAALWGCVGTWFSGAWYDREARRYIADVRRWRAARTWRSYAPSGRRRDIRPPAVPGRPRARSGPRRIALSWAPVAGARSYRVYRGARLVARTRATSRVLGGLSAGVAQRLSVAAVDAAGNSSARSLERRAIPYG